MTTNRINMKLFDDGYTHILTTYVPGLKATAEMADGTTREIELEHGEKCLDYDYYGRGIVETLTLNYPDGNTVSYSPFTGEQSGTIPCKCTRSENYLNRL